jgi:hypothetical protein
MGPIRTERIRYKAASRPDDCNCGTHRFSPSRSGDAQKKHSIKNSRQLTKPCGALAAEELWQATGNRFLTA